jgi:hypothetical protein
MTIDGRRLRGFASESIVPKAGNHLVWMMLGHRTLRPLAPFLNENSRADTA